jgi:hypothetical protein
MNSELISQTINCINEVKLIPNLKAKNKLEKTLLQKDNGEKCKKNLSKPNKKMKYKEKIEIDQDAEYDELNNFSVDKENERIRIKEINDFYDEVNNCTIRLENKIDEIGDKNIKGKGTSLSPNHVNNAKVSDTMTYLKNQSSRNQQSTTLNHYINRGFQLNLLL